jgi:hypothetical protein
MRHALEGHDTPYPIHALCLDMAHGDPLRAKEIYNEIDEEWFKWYLVWRAETHKAKVPDYIVGMYAKE